MKHVIIVVLCLLSIKFLASCNEASASKGASSITLPASLPTAPRNEYSPRIKPYLQLMIKDLSDKTVAYSWNDGCKCNVGILAQLVSGLGYANLRTRKDKEYPDFWKDVVNERKKDDQAGSWMNLINYYCGASKDSMSGIVGQMIAAGFKKRDLIHLEYLNDSAIISKTGALDYANQNDLLTYLKTWDSMIH